MTSRTHLWWRPLIATLCLLTPALAQSEQLGSLRGQVLDGDFRVPLPAARVTLVEVSRNATTTDQGTWVISDVPAGRYTLIFARQGYARQVRTEVIVRAGQLTEIEVSLAGEFVDMDEFVVEDALGLGSGSEAALLALRLESPALLDSISSELMSRAGASDAASALRLVAGATVQDGRFAVIRGLPDRYVSSQINGVRLPSADENTRAAELDQFPSAVIESIQVSKTFTPDQQGDASGGAVDVRLEGIPDERVATLKLQTSYNSQVTGRNDFLTYDGGGVGDFGREADTRAPQLDRLGSNWDGAAGTTTREAPIDSKWSVAFGDRLELDNGWTFGGFASLFYERDSSFYDNGRNDQLWVESPGDRPTPKRNQFQDNESFQTALFDVTQASRSVQWGGLGTLGLENEDHALSLAYLYSHTAEDKATLATDTRGKEFFSPGYDPDDPNTPGHDLPDQAPYLRTDTLEYTERTAGSLQLAGEHKLPFEGGWIFGRPVLDWTLSRSFANLDQPDKRQFGGLWKPQRGIIPPTWEAFKPGANFNLGNFQRIYKSIEEDSSQASLALELPFEQWSGEEGYVKLGRFDDRVGRDFDQDTFSNFGDTSTFEGDFETPWIRAFDDEDHPISESLFDVDYRGDQRISAWYGMADLPLNEELTLIGGARFESTQIDIINDPESGATWIPPGDPTVVALNPGDADVFFSQDDTLPALSLIYEPSERWTLRAAYAETVARQTFKELTPIIQQEFLGGPVFIGNPELGLSELTNYDLRLDYRPYEGGLLSLSWFLKKINDPIEYVQRPLDFVFTTPVNYTSGELSGFEVEARQDLARLWDPLSGVALGGNVTLIDSSVVLPGDEVAQFDLPNIQAPMSTRDATGAPEHLYNVYLTYDRELSGTQASVFYTVRGDTLVAGAGQDGGNFVPNIYALEFGTLNASLSQRLADGVTLQLQAKNLTNPRIEQVYRSQYIGADAPQSSFTTGVEFTIGLNISF